jgi:hypothetical protein
MSCEKLKRQMIPAAVNAVAILPELTPHPISDVQIAGVNSEPELLEELQLRTTIAGTDAFRGW